MHFLPAYFDLRQASIAIVGAGPAAANKLRLLRGSGARVHWYPAGTMDAEHAAGELSADAEICSDDPQSADFSSFTAVICAAGGMLDDEIAARARRHNVPVNVVDRPDLSTFIFPAIVDRGEVVVAIGTGGAAPVLARRLRERIEALLPARIGDLAALLGRFRSRAAELHRGASSLRNFWEHIVDGPIAAAALAGRWREAEAGLARAVSHPGDAGVRTGTVSLVGAGPGDPDLLTLRALQALQAADVIFYDDLVGSDILDRARRDARRVFVGKRSGRPGMAQDAINRALADAARHGLTVVRLKGGDPFIFGRGGEELEYLRQAGIPVVVVPGVTAAIGCTAEAGLPLTLRGVATQLAFITAQGAHGDTAIDWSSYSDPKTTVVIYMGLGKAAVVRDGLIAAGRDAETPAAVLTRGTQADAKHLVGRLDQLAALAARAGGGPGLLIVGEVVAHSEAWHTAAERANADAELAA